MEFAAVESESDEQCTESDQESSDEVQKDHANCKS